MKSKTKKNPKNIESTVLTLLIVVLLGCLGLFFVQDRIREAEYKKHPVPAPLDDRHGRDDEEEAH
jgi:hypothetical protein